MANKPVDGTAALIDQIIEDAKRSVLDSLDHDFSWGMHLCESPIERLFMAQIVHPDVTREYDLRLDIMHPPSGKVADATPPPIPGIYIYPQIEIGDYRVDFLLHAVRYEGTRTLIVECDGHDFHEKTKEQAQRDKARDRYLVSQGYRLVRFTGSEIYRDSLGAVHEALAVLLEIR